ncbi:hypothetical protein SLT36_28270 (plasmid) [Aminobacter sp. BA135]
MRRAAGWAANPSRWPTVPVGKTLESGQQRQCLEVRLLPFAHNLLVRQHTIEQPQQPAGSVVRRGEDTEMEFVVGNDIHRRIETDEAACGAQIQRPSGVWRCREDEVTQFGQRDHAATTAACERTSLLAGRPTAA